MLYLRVHVWNFILQFDKWKKKQADKFLNLFQTYSLLILQANFFFNGIHNDLLHKNLTRTITFLLTQKWKTNTIVSRKINTLINLSYITDHDLNCMMKKKNSTNIHRWNWLSINRTCFYINTRMMFKLKKLTIVLIYDCCCIIAVRV